MKDEKDEKEVEQEKTGFRVANSETAPIEEAKRGYREDGTPIIPDKSKIYKGWFKAAKNKGQEINAISRGKQVSVNKSLNNVSLGKHNTKKKK